MARTLEELKLIFNQAYVNERAEAGLPADDPAAWSRVSRKALLRTIQCFLALTVETIFDLFKTDVDTKLRELKPHSLRWYANKALQYQHGIPLLPDSDLFDNAGYTEEQIAESKVVKYSAVEEKENEYGRVYLRIKLASETGTGLSQLTKGQLEGATEYMRRIKDAGVKLQIDSSPADNIRMKWTVYYDPLILDGQGNRLDGTENDAVKNAITGYLKKLPFNGVYVTQYHIDDVQAVEGVVIAEVNRVETKYGALSFTGVSVKMTPDAGYLSFATDDDLDIQYVPQSPIK